MKKVLMASLILLAALVTSVLFYGQANAITFSANEEIPSQSNIEKSFEYAHDKLEDNPTYYSGSVSLAITPVSVSTEYLLQSSKENAWTNTNMLEASIAGSQVNYNFVHSNATNFFAQPGYYRIVATDAGGQTEQKIFFVYSQLQSLSMVDGDLNASVQYSAISQQPTLTLNLHTNAGAVGAGNTPISYQSLVVQIYLDGKEYSSNGIYYHGATGDNSITFTLTDNFPSGTIVIRARLDSTSSIYAEYTIFNTEYTPGVVNDLTQMLSVIFFVFLAISIFLIFLPLIIQNVVLIKQNRLILKEFGEEAFAEQKVQRYQGQVKVDLSSQEIEEVKREITKEMEEETIHKDLFFSNMLERREMRNLAAEQGLTLAQYKKKHNIKDVRKKVYVITDEPAEIVFNEKIAKEQEEYNKTLAQNKSVPKTKKTTKKNNK